MPRTNILHFKFFIYHLNKSVASKHFEATLLFSSRTRIRRDGVSRRNLRNRNRRRPQTVQGLRE
jgi:hypothetical protein